MIRSTLLATLTAVSLTACSGAADAPTIEVSDAYIVTPAAGRDIAGGGLVVTASGADYTLTSVQADIADTVELHTMAMEDGVMRMRKIEVFTVSAGETRTLERGGDHLMLFGVDDALAAGDTVELLLNFETGNGSTTALNVSADVRALGED